GAAQSQPLRAAADECRPVGRKPRAGDRRGAHDRVQGRRLTGAVRPDQPDDLAGFHLERQVPYGLDGAVPDRELVDGERGHSISSASALSPRYAAATPTWARISCGVPSASVFP